MKAAGDVFNAASKKYPSIAAYSADIGYCGTALNHMDNEMKLKLRIIRVFWYIFNLLKYYLSSLSI